MKSIGTNLTDGNLITGVRKLFLVPDIKKTLFLAKVEASAERDPCQLALVNNLPSPILEKDGDPVLVYRLTRPNENVQYGISARNPLSYIGINYHTSGTRAQSPLISTSVSAMWAISFAKASYRDEFDILSIDSSKSKGDRYRLDTPAHRSRNMNTADPLANANATNAREIVHEAFFPPDSFDKITFPNEVVRRFPSVRRNQTLAQWVATFDSDLTDDISDMFGGLSVDKLL